MNTRDGYVGDAPGYGVILRFAVPLMMGLVTTALHTIIDTAMVGHLGTSSLAALGMAHVYFITCIVLFMGTMRNSISFVGRAVGAGDGGQVGVMLGHYQWVALGVFPLILGFTLLFPFVARLAGLSEGVEGLATEYLTVRVWETPFTLTLLLYSFLYQSFGNSRLPMVVTWVTLVLNVVLNYGLIFGHFGLPALGLRGSALATVLAQAFGAGLILFVTYRAVWRVELGLRFLVRPRWWMFRNILVYSVPQGLGDLSELGSFLLFMTLVGWLGEASLAANNIGLEVTHLMFMPGVAVGIVGASYMGRFLGAGNAGAARVAVRRTLLVGMVYMGMMGVPLWFFGVEIAGIFSDDPVVLALAGPMFKVMALYQVFDALGIILRASLGGAGDTVFPVVVIWVLALGLMMPLAWWLSHQINPPLVGAWWGMLVFLVANSLVLLWRFERGGWAKIELQRSG